MYCNECTCEVHDLGDFTDLFLSLCFGQLRFRVAWWVQGMSAVGRFSVLTTTPVKSKACTTSVSLCCTTPGASTHRWEEAQESHLIKHIQTYTVLLNN